ncbi:probable ubiquitin-conjugating enzyme E2 23 isoform X2 [Physcomitrium patens]|uniref:E2 ubiquitin-conjugating enzyme n=1 Tax=Physcomitrium patens TaxID=3218 RepID=A0A7I4AUP0_PHYPA|nr:probable ubiquitin-conjugating enzyme E2 23 isoform X2 [Physcomitrium patens]|eukprot:XP_024394860.1 probable ubiquitin-conjugating enzyme E2 23 isoform X2 [Physcomitrella patens]
MDRPPEGGDGAEAEGLRASVVQLFQEDIVQSLANPGRIGMVTRVGGDSSDSDSSDSEDEAEDDHDRTLAEGSARIVWIDSQESVEKVADLQVVDRAFMHGDIVALASDPLGQTGTVMDVDMAVDLETSNKEVVKNIDSRLLRRVRALSPGDNVIRGHWLGRVEEVIDNVTVLFDDGSKCKVQHAEPSRLVPSSESLMDDTESPYYPGQRVRAASTGIFKTAKWLRGVYKANRMEGTVSEVEAGLVIVYWIAVSALHSSAVPSEEQDPRDLVPMTYFTHTNWQIGDRAILPQTSKVSAADAGGISSAASEVGALDVRNGESSSLEGSSENIGHNAVELTGSTEGVVDEVAEETADEVAASKQRKIGKLRKVSRKEKKASRKDKHLEKAALVVNTRTSVDILWQDGSKSSKVDSCSLVPIEHVGDHDFWPEQYVLEQGPDGDDLDNEVRRVGILKSVDAKQRTAVVRWLKPVARPEELREFGEEETVSVYELIGHPDYAYCLGDVVIRLAPAPSGVFESESYESDASSVEDAEDHDLDVSEKGKDHVKAQTLRKKSEDLAGEILDLSWVGIIIGLQDGDIEVHWANGLVSKVGPQAVFVVTRDEDDMSSAHTSDLEDENDGDDGASWTTVDSAEERARELELGLEPANEDDEPRRDARPAQETVDDDLNNPNPPLFKGPIAAAIGLVSRMANGLLGLRGNNRDLAHIRNGQGRLPSKHGLEEILDDADCGSSRDSRYVVDRLRKRDTTSCISEEDGRPTSSEQEGESQAAAKDEIDGCAESNEQTDSDLGSRLEKTNISQRSTSEVDTTQDNGSYLRTSSEPGSGTRVLMFENIKHFDIVSDPSDHHYITETAQATSQRRWARKIQSEWSILEKNLPDTIYVRVYEERMDLLRAVILGAPGTPYHDGLFVFDLYLPPEYPHTPPQAYYHSGGLRLNPNLYENGKVCLSLLNTWTGKGTEVWDPQESSILQVLVSIQGLVLNTKPYFNEAGYDRQVGTLEGEKNSVVYNENSFLLSLKSMLYLIRRPPMHFEDLIRKNFKLKGASLLRSCEAYLQGAPVGSLVENKNTSTLADTELVGADKSSAGFKLMLKKLVVKLEEAFKELGVEYDESL